MHVTNLVWHERQCACNIMLRALVQPLLLWWKSNKYCIVLVCVCSLRCQVCKAHAQYWYLWPVRLCCIFLHYLTDVAIKENLLLDITRVLWFYLQLSSGTIHILRKVKRVIIKNMYWTSRKVGVILFRFSKNTKISNFMKIRPVIVEIFHADRQTHRRTWGSL
jgi:hypothetical protein